MTRSTRGGVALGAALSRFPARAWIAVALLGLLGACASPAPPSPTANPAASPTAIPHAPEIRFALIGTVTGANVWSLFDTAGYSYNDYAIRSGYWPRLYDLSIPDGQFEAAAASGDPSAVRQEGGSYTSTVSLRSDLQWSDGSPLTAEDVAFTVNSALAFQLGFDWAAYYDPAWLDHAEATDAHTVKFFFKQMPNVGVWQYGALQGPVVEDKFWSTAVAAASSKLPPADLVAQIASLKATIANLESQLGLLNYNAITSQGEEARQVQSGLKRQQGDLDQALNDLTKAQDEYDSDLNAARGALYGLNDQGEPALGPWTPMQPAAAATTTFVNQANPTYPGRTPHFDRVVYRLYATEQEAQAALAAGQVDVVLDGGGDASSLPAPTNTDAASEMRSPTRSMRFVVFNAQSGAWARRPLRQALACMLNQDDLATSLGLQTLSLTSFVAPQAHNWFNAGAQLPCQGQKSDARLAQAVQILQQAGFGWTEEPSAESNGAGLTYPDGKSVPSTDLLVPESDPLRVKAGDYVQQQANRLGIPITVRSVQTDVIDYAVFSSHSYDLALLGWKVSLYPGYLCDWFGAGKAFAYQASSVIGSCGELSVTSSLDQAAQQVLRIQSALAQDVPFVPLYSEAVYDYHARVRYPFSEVLGGLAEVFGAPSLAVPGSP